MHQHNCWYTVTSNHCVGAGFFVFATYKGEVKNVPYRFLEAMQNASKSHALLKKNSSTCTRSTTAAADVGNSDGSDRVVTAVKNNEEMRMKMVKPMRTTRAFSREKWFLFTCDVIE